MPDETTGAKGPAEDRPDPGAQSPPPPPPPPPPQPPGGYPTAPGGAGWQGPYPRRLTRRMDDRVLGGVASGLGAYFNVDPVVFRVGFVALTLAGGTGILIYLLCLVLLPPAYGPPTTPAGAPPQQGQTIMSNLLRHGGWKTYLAIGAVLLAVPIIFGSFARPPVVLALLLIALGVLLLVQDQAPGGARPGQPGPGGPGTAGGPPPPPPGGGTPPAGWGPQGQWQPTATTTPATGATAAGPAGTATETTAPEAGGEAAGEPAPPSGVGVQPGWGQVSGWGQPPGSGYPPTAARSGWGPSATAVMEPARPRPRSVIGWVTVALALLAGGLAGALDNAGVVNMTPASTLALMLTVIGAGLIVASLWGRAGWLIVIGILLLPAVAATSLLNDTSVTGETGDRIERPLTLAEVRPDYRLGGGQLTLDLSHVRFTRPVAVDARVGAGELVVTVPSNVAVTIHARMGAGDIQALDEHHSGIQVRADVVRGGSGSAGSSLTLDLRVGVGSIRVQRGP
jgi:phage shock protein PspC (stress-responsive transcriptional regulator)